MTFDKSSTAQIALTHGHRTDRVASYQQLKQSAAAELVFMEYAFGENVAVEDSTGWTHSTPGHEWTRKVYVETAREDDGPAPRHTLNFTARFNDSDGSFVEAFALCQDGSEWGSMPAISEEIEALGFPSMSEYYEHQAFLTACKELRLSQELIQPCAFKYLQHRCTGCTGEYEAKFDQYAHLNGQQFMLIGRVDPKTYDAEECGEILVIRFGCGLEISAWPEEVQSVMKVYEVGDDDTGWYAKVCPSGTLFQVQVYDADGDRRPDHEKSLASEKEARDWADKVVLRTHGRLPPQIPVDAEKCVNIAQAFQSYMDDRVIVPKGELIEAIERHMTSTEREKHFYEVHQTLNNMVALGTFVRIEATLPSGRKSTLIAHNGVKLLQSDALTSLR